MWNRDTGSGDLLRNSFICIILYCWSTCTKRETNIQSDPKKGLVGRSLKGKKAEIKGELLTIGREGNAENR